MHFKTKSLSVLHRWNGCYNNIDRLHFNLSIYCILLEQYIIVCLTILFIMIVVILFI